MNCKIIYNDLSIWCNFYSMPLNLKSFIRFFIKYPEFRRLIDFRLKSMKLMSILRLVTYPTSITHNLYIKISKQMGGVMFHHGFSTIINCKSIGNNVHIYQQVTIAMTESGRATIGDDVIIYPGAKIIGNVNIGNDVIIGANAVVVKDIPDHSIVAGVPAKIIKTRNTRADNWSKV